VTESTARAAKPTTPEYGSPGPTGATTTDTTSSATPAKTTKTQVALLDPTFIVFLPGATLLLMSVLYAMVSINQLTDTHDRLEMPAPGTDVAQEIHFIVNAYAGSVIGLIVCIFMLIWGVLLLLLGDRLCKTAYKNNM
jgi:hypothetical protein